MRPLLFRVALTSVIFLLASGCVVARHPHGLSSNSSALESQSCPPGHRWSDGRCHSKGKGHDPGKHGKKRGHQK